MTYDERQPNNDGEEPKATPEELRLERLLSQMPTRLSPERVRQNVLAEIRREIDAGEASDSPREANVVTVAIRRRVHFVLKVAAAVAFCIVGTKVYFEIKPLQTPMPEPKPPAIDVGSDDLRYNFESEEGRIRETAGEAGAIEGVPAEPSDSDSDFEDENKKTPAEVPAAPPGASESKRAEIGKGGFPPANAAEEGYFEKKEDISAKSVVARGKAGNEAAGSDVSTRESGAEQSLEKRVDIASQVQRRVMTATPQAVPKAAPTGPPLEQITPQKPSRPVDNARDVKLEVLSEISVNDEIRTQPGSKQPLARSGSGGRQLNAAGPSQPEPALTAPTIETPPMIPQPDGRLRPDDFADAPTQAAEAPAQAEYQTADKLKAREVQDNEGADRQQQTQFDANGAVMLGVRMQEVTPPNLTWYELESPKDLQQKFVQRNSVESIEVPEQRDAILLDGDATTSWAYFANNGTVGVNDIVSNYGGLVTDAREVVVKPGERQAVMVEADVPLKNSDTLANTVNQKRVVALFGDQPKSAEGTEAQSGRSSDSRARAEFLAAGVVAEESNRRKPSGVNLEAVKESDLVAKDPVAFTNFYIQALPQAQLSSTANGRLFSNADTSVTSSESIVGQQFGFGAGAFGGFGATNGIERYAIQTEPSSTQPVTLDSYAGRRFGGAASTPSAMGATGGWRGGQFAGKATAGSYFRYAVPALTSQTVRMYFLIEPDPIPLRTPEKAAVRRNP